MHPRIRIKKSKKEKVNDFYFCNRHKAEFEKDDDKNETP